MTTTNSAATAVQNETNEKQPGLTREEIILCVDLALKFVYNDDGTPKEGNLPAGLLAEFNGNKLARMLELTAENKQLWWACHLAARCHKGGVSYDNVARAFSFIQNRYSAITSKRIELMAEINRLGLDPERVRGLTVAQIDEKLTKLKEARKADSLRELHEILRMVNLLEAEAKCTETTEVDLDPEHFKTKSDTDAVKKELLDRKAEVETILRKQALEASRALKARIATKAA